jgi:hypothetical protein
MILQADLYPVSYMLEGSFLKRDKEKRELTRGFSQKKLLTFWVFSSKCGAMRLLMREIFPYKKQGG